MKKNILYNGIILIVFLLMVLVSCENNNEVDLYGEQFCDTTNVTWDSTISKILSFYCVSCHGPDISYNNVRHDSYVSELVVVNDGRLRGVVNQYKGFPQMPFDGPKLPPCQVYLINIWLDNGAPEN